jgi:hypothetical protein
MVGNVYLPSTAASGFQKPPRKFIVPIGTSKAGSSHAVDGMNNPRRNSGGHGNNLDGYNFGPHHQSQDGPILNDLSINSVSQHGDRNGNIKI